MRNRTEASASEDDLNDPVEPRVFEFGEDRCRRMKRFISGAAAEVAIPVEDRYRIARVGLAADAQDFVDSLDDEEVREHLVEVIRFHLFRAIPAIVRDASVGAPWLHLATKRLPN